MVPKWTSNSIRLQLNCSKQIAFGPGNKGHLLKTVQKSKIETIIKLVKRRPGFIRNVRLNIPGCYSCITKINQTEFSFKRVLLLRLLQNISQIFVYLTYATHSQWNIEGTSLSVLGLSLSLMQLLGW